MPMDTLRRLSYESPTSPTKVTLPHGTDLTLTVIGEEHLVPVVLTDDAALLLARGADLHARGVRPTQKGSLFATVSIPTGTRVYVRGRRISNDDIGELLAVAVHEALKNALEPARLRL